MLAAVRACLVSRGVMFVPRWRGKFTILASTKDPRNHRLYSTVGLIRPRASSTRLAQGCTYQSEIEPGMDTPVPVKSRRQLKKLFTDNKLRDQWIAILPVSKEALDCAPSQSSKHFTEVYGSGNDVKEFLCNKFEAIFDQHGHVTTFWDKFERNLTLSLGMTYRVLSDVSNIKLDKYSELQLQQMVLNPLIQRLSEAIMFIPDSDDAAIRADFLVQDEIKIVNRRGQRPAVDAIIQMSRADDYSVITCVPVEMKVLMNNNHFSQIACYMNKLSTAEELSKHIMIGILIDKWQFRMVFSPSCKGDVPLPIVHISPPTQWRSEATGMIDRCAMLSLACTLLTGKLERQEYTEESCGGMLTSKLTELGKQLLQNPHKLGRPETQSVDFRSLKREYDKKLADQGSVIAEQAKRIEKLESLFNIR